MPTWAVYTGAAAVLAAIGFAAAVSTGVLSLPWSGAPTEHSARYYPADVVAYAWSTSEPARGQREQMSHVRERFDEMRGFRVWMDRIYDHIEDRTGFDLEEDVLSWAGPEFSAAILDVDIDDYEIDAAGTIDVRDRDAAAEFLADWLDYLEDDRGADFDRESISGYASWVDDGSRQAYALAEDVLVFATTERALKEVLGRIAGERTPVLADERKFREAQAALPGRRFTSLYVDYERAADLAFAASLQDGTFLPSIGGWFGLEALLPDSADLCGGSLIETPGWAAASAAWVERGVLVEMVSPAAALPQQPDAAGGAGLLSEDALGFISVSFDPETDRWREALRECAIAELVPGWEEALPWVNALLPGLIAQWGGLTALPPSDGAPELADDATLADALDLGLSAVYRLVGVHLEHELLDHLGGELVAAVYHIDFEGARSGGLRSIPFDGAAMLSYRPEREDELAETLGGLADRFALLTGPAERADVGAENDARILGLDEWQLRPGYVLHDGYLIIGTGEDSLRTAVAQQNDGGEGLAASREYRRAVGHLPDGGQVLAYVDLQRAVDSADPDVLGVDAAAYEVLANGVSAAAMTSSMDGEHTRAVLVLTLLPEE